MTHQGEISTYIAQGEQAIGDQPNMVIATILGSCVSVCLWDIRAGVGGMNHILVPDNCRSDFDRLNVEAGAMESLVNALLKAGATRGGLEAKVFGGAAVVAGLSNIGSRNAAFVMEYLNNENIEVVSQSVGGTQARKLRFWPATGRASQKFVSSEEPVLAAPKPKIDRDVELF